MADLARAISLPIEFDFMAVSSYGNATISVGLFECQDLDIDLSGRDVIVVEDIIDSGLAQYLEKTLNLEAQRHLKFALLVQSGRQVGELGLKYVVLNLQIS